jgi:hypothetical protein
MDKKLGTYLFVTMHEDEDRFRAELARRLPEAEPWMREALAPVDDRGRPRGLLAGVYQTPPMSNGTSDACLAWVWSWWANPPLGQDCAPVPALAEHARRVDGD